MKQSFDSIIDSNCALCRNDISSTKDLALRTIGTNAFVDLNLDCSPDIVLESQGADGAKYLELYMYERDEKFRLFKIIKFPKDLQNLSLGTFADIDNDKTMDLVFWNKDIDKLQVFYGVYEEQDQIKEYDQCMEKGLRYSIPGLESAQLRSATSQTLDILPGSKLFESREQYIWPVVRLGDLSLNGLPDLIVNLVTKEGKRDVFLFENQDCP